MNENIYIEKLELLDKNLIDKIRELISVISDESDNFPFDYQEFNMTDYQLECYFNSLIIQENSVCFLAKHNEELIGIAYLEGGKKSRTYHLTSLGMGIKKSYIGIGIGSCLLTHIIEYAVKGEYIAKIDAIVEIDNLSAVNLYKKFGFVCEGKLTRALFINDNFYDVLCFGKKID